MRTPWSQRSVDMDTDGSRDWYRRRIVNITVIGLGYVGAVSAACLAQLGNNVVGVDLDQHKSDAISRGQSPIAEPGLDEILGAQVASGRLRVDTLSNAVAASDLIMVAVGTPSNRAGGLDLSAVLRVTEEIGRSLPLDGQFRTIVIRSTVLPGTTEGEVQPVLERASGQRVKSEIGLATNPEFLRESTSIRDFYDTTRTIIGAEDERSASAVRTAYQGLDAPVFVVPIRTAELVKYTDNAFHAVKIAFANEIASFARAFGVDGRDAMQVLTADPRLNISPAYLRPGYAFGGSCLPKDLRALTDRARKTDLQLPLLEGIVASNAAHFERGVALIESLGRREVAILGLSFKASTDDLRESPAVALAERLLGKGFRLRIFDEDVRPKELLGANRAFIEGHLPHLAGLLVDTVDEALETSEVVVIAKASQVATDLPTRLRPGQAVVDLVGLPWGAADAPGPYFGIGW